MKNKFKLTGIIISLITISSCFPRPLWYFHKQTGSWGIDDLIYIYKNNDKRKSYYIYKNGEIETFSVMGSGWLKIDSIIYYFDLHEYLNNSFEFCYTETSIRYDETYYIWNATIGWSFNGIKINILEDKTNHYSEYSKLILTKLSD